MKERTRWSNRREAIIAGLLISLCAPLMPGRTEDAPPASATPAPSGSTGDKKTSPEPADSGSTSSAPATDSKPPAESAEKKSDVKTGEKADAKPDEAPGKTESSPKPKETTITSSTKSSATKTGSHPVASRTGVSGHKPPKGKPASAQPPKRDLLKILGPLPRKRVSMDFRGMDIDNVLLMFSSWAGVTILKDPGLSGPVNLIQGQEVSLQDAFKILDAYLSSKNFTLERDDLVLKVVPKTAAAPPPGPSGPPPPSTPPEVKKEDEDEKVTKIFPLRYASAQTAVKIINDVFGGAGGGGGQPQPGQPGGPPPGQPPQGGPAPAAAGGRTKSQRRLAAQVKATADYDTNQVIVVGDAVVMDDIQEIINGIDKQLDIPLETRTWELKYALVNDVVTQVSAVLASISGTGRGSAYQDVPFERRVLGGGGGGGGGYYGGGTPAATPQTAAGGRVISDPRTNTLTVIATHEQLEKVNDIIQAVDKKIEYASTTFMVPLKHLEASEAAFVLSQLLQKRNNNNGFPFFFFGGGGNQNQNQVRQRRRLGDPQSARPETGTRNNNGGFFGFSSNERDTSAPPDSVAASIAAAQNLQPGDPQATAPTVTAANDGSRPRLPIQSVTLDGAQLAQWWDNGGGSQSNDRTGRDEGGRVRPLVNLNGQVTIVPDLNTNGLIVNTDPSNMPALKEILAMIDQPPAQVLIEAIIVEASLDSSTKLGVTFDWTEAFNSSGTAQHTHVNLPTSTQQGGLTFTALGNSFQAVIQAVKNDQRFNVLSTPRILTQNNQQAQIAIGTDVPILQTSTSFGSVSSSIQFKNIGVLLDVTPHITSDGFVNLEVSQDANELQGFTTLGDNQVPIISRRSTETSVSMKDGEAIVLGGLIRNSVQNNQTKIPILGDLPLLGSLFRSKDRTHSKTELMMFMRTHIVRRPSEVDELTTQQAGEAGITPDSKEGKHMNLIPPDPPAPKDDGKKKDLGPLPPTDGPT